MVVKFLLISLPFLFVYLNFVNKNNMTQQEIIDYNKRCAEFMYPYAKEEYESGEISVDDGLFKKATWVFGQYDLMRYHSDWNWIMEVVERINELPLCERTYNLRHIKISAPKEAIVNEINRFLIEELIEK